MRVTAPPGASPPADPRGRRRPPDRGDRLLGLRLGADDYVVKPFLPPELAARIRSVLRRSSSGRASTRLELGELAIDLAAREVRVGDRAVGTTAKEFDLLTFLASSPPPGVHAGPAPRAGVGFLGELAGPGHRHRARLCKKIEERPDHPRWLRTVRGVGYRFEP